MLKRIAAFMSDESGLETVEYAIILGLIVAATITAIVTLGGTVNTKFARINTDFTP